MAQTSSLEQAQAIASLLPSLVRRLFVLADDLASELPLAQLRVCAILYGGPRPMSTLSRETGVSLSAMTQIADRLERAGLVRRVAEGSDRRIKCLQLTPHGEKTMRLREAARVERISAALKHLSPQARKQVLAGLERLMDACASMGEQGAVMDGSAMEKVG
jgi:DNA-binding MarR family transcriptional regulator